MTCDPFSGLCTENCESGERKLCASRTLIISYSIFKYYFSKGQKHLSTGKKSAAFKKYNYKYFEPLNPTCNLFCNIVRPIMTQYAGEKNEWENMMFCNKAYTVYHTYSHLIVCMPGWYGNDCSRRCSKSCLNASCDVIHGTCLFGRK